MFQHTRAVRTSAAAPGDWAPAIDRLEGRALLSTAPTTTASIMGQAGANGYYVSPVTIALTATEPNVPPAALTTMYRVNHGPFTTGNLVILTEDGTGVVQFFSGDPSGNIEAVQTPSSRSTRPHPFSPSPLCPRPSGLRTASSAP